MLPGYLVFFACSKTWFIAETFRPKTVDFRVATIPANIAFVRLTSTVVVAHGLFLVDSEYF